MKNNLYIVDIEFRYSDWNNEEERSTQKSKTVTIGIYNTYEEAVKAGNEMLETQLETRFPLNPYYKRKERFGEIYAYSKRNLISELTYLTTPFNFFAHIRKLEISPVSETIDEVLKAENRYKEGKNKACND